MRQNRGRPPNHITVTFRVRFRVRNRVRVRFRVRDRVSNRVWVRVRVRFRVRDRVRNRVRWSPTVLPNHATDLVNWWVAMAIFSNLINNTSLLMFACRLVGIQSDTRKISLVFIGKVGFRVFMWRYFQRHTAVTDF